MTALRENTVSRACLNRKEGWEHERDHIRVDAPAVLVNEVFTHDKYPGSGIVITGFLNCPNAIGSAISKVSGTYEKLMNYDELPREQSLEKVRSETVEPAVETTGDLG